VEPLGDLALIGARHPARRIVMIG